MVEMAVMVQRWGFWQEWGSCADAQGRVAEAVVPLAAASIPGSRGGVQQCGGILALLALLQGALGAELAGPPTSGSCLTAQLPLHCQP